MSIEKKAVAGKCVVELIDRGETFSGDRYLITNTALNRKGRYQSGRSETSSPVIAENIFARRIKSREAEGYTFEKPTGEKS